MKKIFKQIPAQEATWSCPRDGGWWGEDARRGGACCAQRGSRAPGAGSAPPVGAMYHCLRPAPQAGGDCSKATAGPRRGSPCLGPAPFALSSGRRDPPPAVLLQPQPSPRWPPPAARWARSVSVYMLGNRRLTDLLSLTLPVGAAQRSSRVCVTNPGLHCTDTLLSRRPAHSHRPHPFQCCARGEGAAAAHSSAQLWRPQPERRSCSDSCLAFSRLQRGPPTPILEASGWGCTSRSAAGVHVWQPTASPDLLCNLER